MKKLIISLVLLFAPMIAFASIDTNLYYGIQNKPAVQELQEFLIDKGFLTVTATGNFYSLTLKAVKAYQNSTGLPKTGYVGVLTRKAMNDELVANLKDSNTQAIGETGSMPPTPQPVQPVQNILNQIAQNTTPPQAQPTPIPVQGPVQPTVIQFPFEPIIKNFDNRSLAVIIKEKFDKCNLIITDENGHKVREQNYWMTDNDGNSRQVYDMGTYGQHAYSITCNKAGFDDSTKVGKFPIYAVPVYIEATKETDGIVFVKSGGAMLDNAILNLKIKVKINNTLPSNTVIFYIANPVNNLSKTFYNVSDGDVLEINSFPANYELLWSYSGPGNKSDISLTITGGTATLYGQNIDLRF